MNSVVIKSSISKYSANERWTHEFLEKSQISTSFERFDLDAELNNGS